MTYFQKKWLKAIWSDTHIDLSYEIAMLATKLLINDDSQTGEHDGTFEGADEIKRNCEFVTNSETIIHHFQDSNKKTVEVRSLYIYKDKLYEISNAWVAEMKRP